MKDKQHIRLTLHVSMVEELRDLIKRINKSYDDYDIARDKHTAEEDYVSESEAVEFCINEYEEDVGRESVRQIIYMIERMRDAKENENKINKSFRINVQLYDVLVNLKQSLNKYNTVYKTYKIEDVVEYLIQTYSLNV